MPTGPQGQKHPGDVIGNAITVARIATGNVQDTKTSKSARTKSGKDGAAARAKKLSADERSEIARHAASKRWE